MSDESFDKLRMKMIVAIFSVGLSVVLISSLWADDATTSQSTATVLPAATAPLQPSKAYDLSTVLNQDSLWSLSKDHLETTLKDVVRPVNAQPQAVPGKNLVAIPSTDVSFNWTSPEKVELKARGSPLRYRDLPVSEVIFRYRDEKLAAVYLCLYNRGDTGFDPGKDFRPVLSQIEQTLADQSRVQGQNLPSDSWSSSLLYLNGAVVWFSPKLTYRLEYAVSRQTDGDGREIYPPEFMHLFIFPGGQAADDLASFVNQNTLWSLSKDQLVSTLKNFAKAVNLDPEVVPGKDHGTTPVQVVPFKWTSPEKTELRAGDFPMVYQKLPVSEAIFRYREDKLSEVYLSLYNRGDAGSKKIQDFLPLVTQIEQILQTQSGVEGQPVDDSDDSSKFRNQVKIWLSDKVCYRLITAYSKENNEDGTIADRPEFANLTIFPGGLTADEVSLHRQADVEFVDYDKRVKHDDNGDVWIPKFPMVDQGSKGYCAVATMERILRYYGSQVDEHELAERANTNSVQGTYPDSLSMALRSMSSSLGLNFSEFRKVNDDDILNLVDSYNRVARRMGVDEVNSDQDCLKEMHLPVLRELKLKDRNRVDAFLQYISTNIDKGWPVAWSVILGWVDENPPLYPGTFGAHMRTIIGYNSTTQEIIYSDSWGLGHEFKRMSVDDAYVISQNLYIVEPKL